MLLNTIFSIDKNSDDLRRRAQIQLNTYDFSTLLLLSQCCWFAASHVTDRKSNPPFVACARSRGSICLLNILWVHTNRT